MNARRDSRFLTNEVQKMNGLLSDIKMDKKYEEQLLKRYGGEDISPTKKEDLSPIEAKSGKDVDDTVQVSLDMPTNISDSKILDDAPRLRKDEEILSDAIREHKLKIKDKPRLDKNPLY